MKQSRRKTFRKTKRLTRRNPTFKTIPIGTKVTWHYRSAIGHGKVIGIHKLGMTADKTMYNVRQTDYHIGEPAILHHSGKALKPV